MSKKVDTSKPLSRDDFLYLRDRGRLPAEYTLSDEAEAQVEITDDTDLSKCSVAELRSLARDRGIPQAGSKAELIARLQQSGQGEPDDDESF